MAEPSVGRLWPRAASRWLDWARGLKSSTQALIPGAYAWVSTVAPVAFSHGAGSAAKAGAVFAITTLAAGAVGERRWGAHARLVSLWGLVVGSAVTWITAPLALGPTRFDLTRGLAGMLGWALFALAVAAPSAPAESARAVEVDGVDRARPLLPRRPVARGDAVYLAGGMILVAGLAVVGWQIPVVERALLVRAVALAASLATLRAATVVAEKRRRPGDAPDNRAWVRGVIAPLALLAALLLGGLLFALID